MTIVSSTRAVRSKIRPPSTSGVAQSESKTDNRRREKIVPINGHVAAAPIFDFSKDPGYYHAPAKKALLRRGKRPPHDEFAIDFSGPTVQVQVCASGHLLLSGTWDWSAAAAGTTLARAGDWKEVGWHRERCCDYLEIELPLSDGYKLERQIFFARNELFFFAADCLIGPPDTICEMHYTHAIPLAAGVSFSAAEQTCESWLSSDGGRMASVIPLAQPEWRSAYRHARLTTSDDKLAMEQAAHGRRLLSPLWIDIHPSRIRRPITWRQLTVGENLAAVNRDVAVGYRVQAGNEQWLVYRSLAPVANRSIMGHNTYGSFVCGRIKPDGSVKDILTME
jgi:hypothetical protein